MINTNDKDQDGILTGDQHNTLDSAWQGKVAWLSIYYQTALRATAEMANEMDDNDYANKLLKIAERGKKYTEEYLFNGEYFFHLPDPNREKSTGIHNGNEYSQLFGQSWAYAVGIGSIIDPEKVTTALDSLWRYNFTTDVGPYRKLYTPGRWYAMPEEGGFIAATWPNGGQEALKNDNPRFAAYNHESQNGYEYALSSLMMWHNSPYRALAHTRIMHEDRYHGSKRNPFNEIEWGLHYARSMASYGLFTAVSGFQYHGPKGEIGFDPKIQQENFKSAFVGATGWGSYTQNFHESETSYSIVLNYGELMLKQLSLPILAKNIQGKVEVKLDGNNIAIQLSKEEGKLVLQFDSGVNIGEGSILTVRYH